MPREIVAARYGLDIETDTRTDGLDPAVSQVMAAAVATERGATVFTGPEPELLAALDHHLGLLAPGVLVTWNGGCFDLPFLAERARRRGIELGLALRPDPAIPSRPALTGHPGGYRARWHDHTHLDAYQAYRRWTRALGVTGSLKAVARMAGLTPIEVDRARVHELDPGALCDYVASDARLALELACRCWKLARAWADDRAAPAA